MECWSGVQWSHGVAFWSVFWNGIKLEFVLFFVAHLFKNVNQGNS